MKLFKRIVLGVAGVGTVAGFVTTMIIVNKHTENIVRQPNSEDKDPAG